MIDKKDLSQNPTPEEQAENRRFLIEGLENTSPLHAGNIQECLPFMDEQAKHEAGVINALLPYAHWFGTVEVYSNGFNAYVKSMYAIHAVMIYRYRRS